MCVRVLQGGIWRYTSGIVQKGKPSVWVCDVEGDAISSDLIVFPSVVSCPTTPSPSFAPLLSRVSTRL